MIVGSVCSGIGCDSVAFTAIGWRVAFHSEIEPFSRAVLRERFPDIPLRGDFRKIREGEHEPIDILVGGTPCQSFSVAGLGGGLSDERGNLALEFFRLARRLLPRWIVWENVPGALSENGGRDFGSIIGAMERLGYSVAWRILDAQFVRTYGFPFAVPQRRRRLFVVGHLGDWAGPAAVLLERDSLQGNPPPRRISRKDSLGAADASFDEISGTDLSEVSLTLLGHHSPRFDYESETIVPAVADPLTVSEQRTYTHEGTNNFRLHNVIPFDTTQVTHPENRSRCEPGDPAPTLARLAQPPAIAGYNAVRRLTPLECERLMGLPDGWTLIPWKGALAKDSPRYRAIGLGMAVNVMQWLGGRIDMVDAVLKTREAAE